MYSYQTFFEKGLYQYTTELCHILHNHGSDKSAVGGKKHNYGSFYHYLLSNQRLQIANVFELGLGTNDTSIPSNMGGGGTPCGSLRAWKEYFPNATIYGADIDEKILVQEDRIKTYYCDQQDPESIKTMWNKIALRMDLIIDDGLHTYNANSCFINHSLDKLNNGGHFIIEDIQTAHISQYEQLISDLRKTCQSVSVLTLPHFNDVDNTLLVVQK